jgi:hypothetical protein
MLPPLDTYGIKLYTPATCKHNRKSTSKSNDFFKGTTNVASSNPAQGEVYSKQREVIKFVSDLRQVGGFLWVLRFPAPIKLKYC